MAGLAGQLPEVKGGHATAATARRRCDLHGTGPRAWHTVGGIWAYDRMSRSLQAPKLLTPMLRTSPSATSASIACTGGCSANVSRA